MLTRENFQMALKIARLILIISCENVLTFLNFLFKSYNAAFVKIMFMNKLIVSEETYYFLQNSTKN